MFRITHYSNIHCHFKLYTIIHFLKEPIVKKMHFLSRIDEHIFETYFFRVVFERMGFLLGIIIGNHCKVTVEKLHSELVLFFG